MIRYTTRRLLADDQGRVTAFVTIMVAAVLLVCALVLDGGVALAAKSHALGVAQEAARAGAQHIDLAEYRATGQLRLDPDQATRAAHAHLAAAGMRGAVTATPTRITVTATAERPTQLLGAVGIDALTATATASAEPRQTTSAGG